MQKNVVRFFVISGVSCMIYGFSGLIYENLKKQKMQAKELYKQTIELKEAIDANHEGDHSLLEAYEKKYHTM